MVNEIKQNFIQLGPKRNLFNHEEGEIYEI